MAMPKPRSAGRPERGERGLPRARRPVRELQR